MKNMKKIATAMGIAALAAFSALSGCMMPPPKPGTAGSLSLVRDNVKVEDDVLGNLQLGFDLPHIQRLPGGLVKVSIPVTNISAEILKLDYRYTFFTDRMILEAPMPFTRKDISPGQTLVFETTSIGAVPESPKGNYLLEIRRLKIGE
jgi:hypothetical protein